MTEITPTESTDDLLSRQKREIAERIEQLRPMIDEYNLLQNALNALEGNAAAPRRRGRPPKNQQS